MNKKGFTLVELLAVIAVLAVLVVLITPNIISNFGFAKENSFLNEVREIYSVSKNQYVTDKAFNKNVTAYTKNGNYSCAEKLDLSGRGEFDYYVEFDEDGNVIKLYATDGTYQYEYEGSGLQKSTIKEASEATETTLESKINLICTEAAPPVIADDTAMFDNGQTVNGIMKTIANGSTMTYANNDTLVYAIVKANTLKDGLGSSNIVSASTSPNPIYMWFENGTLYWYSDARKVYLNKSAANMFKGFVNLSDISSLSNFDTSYTESFLQLFMTCPSLTNISALSSWNTSNVKNFQSLFNTDDTVAIEFGHAGSLTSLVPLKYWNTSKVTNMKWMFQDQANLTNLSGLEYWNTSNVTTLENAFGLSTYVAYAGYKSKLYDLSALANWDVRKVENMNATFANNISLKNLHGLENWKTDSLKYMDYTFYNDSSLENISALHDWNTSNVTTMKELFNLNDNFINAFRVTGSIKSFQPLENWNTSKVTNFQLAFQDQVQVPNLNGLENFSLQSATTAEYMFGNSPVAASYGFRCKIQNYNAINGWTYSSNTIKTQVTNSLNQCTNTRD